MRVSTRTPHTCARVTRVPVGADVRRGVATNRILLGSFYSVGKHQIPKVILSLLQTSPPPCSPISTCQASAPERALPGPGKQVSSQSHPHHHISCLLGPQEATSTAALLPHRPPTPVSSAGDFPTPSPLNSGVPAPTAQTSSLPPSLGSPIFITVNPSEATGALARPSLPTRPESYGHTHNCPAPHHSAVPRPVKPKCPKSKSWPSCSHHFCVPAETPPPACSARLWTKGGLLPQTPPADPDSNRFPPTASGPSTPFCCRASRHASRDPHPSQS